MTSEDLKNRKTGIPDKKLIVWFTNDEKGLILNKTNLRTLQGAFGDDTTKWNNKIIVIYPMMTELGPGLRVRIPPPKQAAAAPKQSAPAPTGNGAAAAPPVTAAAPQQSAPTPQDRCGSSAACRGCCRSGAGCCCGSGA